MNFMQSVKTCFSKYITFSGRASRSEFWWFVLFLIIGRAIAGWLDMAIFGTSSMMMGDMYYYYHVAIIGGIFSFLTFLPALSVEVRRLHDLDKSGWWILLVFIPLIGAIILLVWLAGKGTQGDNSFGSAPQA